MTYIEKVNEINYIAKKKRQKNHRIIQNGKPLNYSMHKKIVKNNRDFHREAISPSISTKIEEVKFYDYQKSLIIYMTMVFWSLSKLHFSRNYHFVLSSQLTRSFVRCARLPPAQMTWNCWVSKMQSSGGLGNISPELAGIIMIRNNDITVLKISN